jgi:hypothetical protein
MTAVCFPQGRDALLGFCVRARGWAMIALCAATGCKAAPTKIAERDAPPPLRADAAPPKPPPWADPARANIVVAEPSHALVDPDSGGATGPITITSASSELVVTAAPIDPFDTHIEAVRTAGVGCFSGMSEGEYAVTVHGRVASGGTVVSTNVIGLPTDDEAVLRCLRTALERHVFPATELGRDVDVRIGVTIKRNP